MSKRISNRRRRIGVQREWQQCRFCGAKVERELMAMWEHVKELHYADEIGVSQEEWSAFEKGIQWEKMPTNKNL